MLKLVGAAFSLLSLVSGASQLWTARSIRSYPVPIISTSVVAGLINFNLFCRRADVVDDKRFPEGLKIRKSTAQSGPWELWTSTG